MRRQHEASIANAGITAQRYLPQKITNGRDGEEYQKTCERKEDIITTAGRSLDVF